MEIRISSAIEMKKQFLPRLACDTTKSDGQVILEPRRSLHCRTGQPGQANVTTWTNTKRCRVSVAVGMQLPAPIGSRTVAVSLHELEPKLVPKHCTILGHIVARSLVAEAAVLPDHHD